MAALSLLAFTVLCVARPAFAAPNAPAVDDKTVVIAIEKDIQNLDALVTASGDSMRYGWLIYDTLYGFDETGNLTPHMATGYTLSPDGLTYTFELRADVLFHDGSKMTSEDVKYTIERVLDPKVRSTRRPYFAPVVDTVETPDPTTVVIHLKQPDGAFLNKIAGFLFIVPKAYVSSLPTSEAFAAAPIGTGPFKFKRYSVGQALELDRFDGYWGKKPSLEHIVMKVITEPSTRVNALLTGEVDVVVQLPPEERDRVAKEPNLDVFTTPVDAPMFVRLYTNDPSSPLSKLPVRQALNYALDKDAIVRSVYSGVGEPMGSFISHHFPYGADPNVKPYPYDPAKAKALLKEAGYPNGFSIKLNDGNDHAKELAEAIAAYWGQVGVKTDIQRIDYAAWSRLNNTHKSGPMTLTQFTNAIYDPIHGVGGTFSKDGSWSDYFNPEVQALIESLDSTSGAEQRGAKFRRIDRLLHDDAASVWITELFYVYAKKKAFDWKPQLGSGFIRMTDAHWQE